MPHQPGSTASFLRSIEDVLRARADAEQALRMRAYLLDQFPFLGLPAPVRRDAVKDLSRAFRPSAEELLEVAHALWEHPEREFRYTAIDLLGKQVRRLGPGHLPALLSLLRREPWWETVDGLSGVIGKLLLGQVQAGHAQAAEVTEEWIVHPDLWVRRCAMLHQLGWRLATDTARLSRHALRLAPEPDVFLRKATGWALRDFARWNPAWVGDFLRGHRAHFSGLTLREAGKHLEHASAARAPLVP